VLKNDETRQTNALMGHCAEEVRLCGRRYPVSRITCFLPHYQTLQMTLTANYTTNNAWVMVA